MKLDSLTKTADYSQVINEPIMSWMEFLHASTQFYFPILILRRNVKSNSHSMATATVTLYLTRSVSKLQFICHTIRKSRTLEMLKQKVSKTQFFISLGTTYFTTMILINELDKIFFGNHHFEHTYKFYFLKNHYKYLISI